MTQDLAITLEQANSFLMDFADNKVKLMSFCKPKVTEINDKSCTIKIPLNDITKNHLHSMYFGTLAIGADCAGGFLAMMHIMKSGHNISLIFKDFQADFVKRALGDVSFTCANGEAIAKAVKETISSGERVNAPLDIIATVNENDQDEVVAKCRLTLSVKYKA